MTFQTTAKNILANYNTIIFTGYCNLQHLLQYENPIAYTAGIYGWNADIYTVNNIAICTGYRPFGNIRPNYDITRKYDDLAREIINAPYKDKLNTMTDYTTEANNRREKLTALLNEFITEVLNNENQ